MQVGLERLIDPKLAAYVDEARAFYAARAASRGAALQPDPGTPEGLQEARALEEARARSIDSAVSPGPQAVEALAEVGGRRVPVRIFAPRSGTAGGVYLDIHGGGFYMGLAARGDAHNRRLAHAVGIAVVSVDYRLAPEHPWPAAPDDCETAALWLLAEAEARFGTTRLAIGGVSAGATLAMATLLRLRDRGAAGPFVGAALQFGTSSGKSATTRQARSPRPRGRSGPARRSGRLATPIQLLRLELPMWWARGGRMLKAPSRQEAVVALPLPPVHRHRFSLPAEPGRRTATWSLLMVAGTAVALLVAWAVGTFLQVVVFDLGDQESIGHAGAWGYVAGLLLLALMTLPALAGIILGIRARRLGERSRGAAGVVVNALIVAYLVFPGVAYILFG